MKNSFSITLRAFGIAVSLATLSFAITPVAHAVENRPNIVFVLTDDQGYGDLGCTGNDKIKTPNIDALSRQSVVLNTFFVCPVCTPTRASLMTGRYNYRTGAIDTFIGRAMMHADELTLAEILRDAGYATGIFGKWHLGDNYPLRAIDQGFQDALVHSGGGIGQPGDAPGNTYFSPLLQRNGKPQKSEGYCTDVFTNAAMEFIEKNRERPFFLYLPTNAPHDPLQVADAYVEPYRKMGLDEKIAKVYGMVQNIDENVGRLLAKLRELKLEDNTIVIFMTDNGPSGARYNAGMRGQKCSVYDGGIRVPCFIRWPAKLKAGTQVNRIAAHIDILPTLLEACGVPRPAVKLDGLNLLPLLQGNDANWPERTLYFQWHRGDEPKLFENCAARTQRYKLVDGKELYDLAADPAESKNIAADKPDIAATLRAGYEEWFRDVSSTRGYAPPRIQIGTAFENPTILSRQDWRGPRAGWNADSLGHWEVDVKRSASYSIKLDFAATPRPRIAHVKFGDTEASMPVDAKSATITIPSVKLYTGEGKLEAWLSADEKTVGVHYVEIKPVE